MRCAICVNRAVVNYFHILYDFHRLSPWSRTVCLNQ
nr:MAG TPA: hypothetical protein [Caudoviricetes sp.]